MDAGLRQHDSLKTIGVMLAKASIHVRARGEAMRNSGTVYMLASQPRGTLYLGVTSDLNGRVWQHRTGAFEGFTKRYDVKRLVWFEHHADIAAAIAREKAIKFWRRAWKVAAIEATNPHWDDLAVGLGFEPLPMIGERSTG